MHIFTNERVTCFDRFPPYFLDCLQLKKKLKWYSFSIKGPEWFANTAKAIFGELEFINLSLHWRITKHFEKGYLLLLPANIGLVGGPESSPQTVLYSYVTKIK